MDQDKYSIGWNTFQKHVQQTFEDLYNNRNFSDVTLVTDDLVQIQAHRIVLSSASTLFEQLLMINSNSTNSILF